MFNISEYMQEVCSYFKNSDTNPDTKLSFSAAHICAFAQHKYSVEVT